MSQGGAEYGVDASFMLLLLDERGIHTKKPAPHARNRRYDGAVHSSLRFHNSAASSGVATRLGARSAHVS